MTEVRGPRGWSPDVAPAGAYHRLRDDHDDRIRELDPITAAEALRELSEVLP